MIFQNLSSRAYRIIPKLHMYLLRAFFISLFLLCILGASCVCVFAENFNLYSSVGSNDTYVKNLIAIYQNSPNYDPYNEFEVARVGQYDYRLFYGRDLDSDDYKYYQYVGTPSQIGVNFVYSGGTGSNLRLNKNNFVTVGNVENSLKNFDAETYKYQYVMVGLTFLVVIVILFKVFRQNVRTKSREGWRI